MRNAFCSLVFPLLFAALLLSSFGERDTPLFRMQNDTIILATPAGWPKPMYDFKKNPVTKAGFELGRKLFFDPMLSRDSTISCASCHLQFTNFTHVDHALSHGILGRKGTRNTLSIINAAWSRDFMWDGGANSIEVQPLAPIENPAEMDSKLDLVVERVTRAPAYAGRFRNAFGSDEVTGQRVLKALAQYMLCLQSSNSKYDRVMRKEPGVAFSAYEAKGLALFRKNCASCHAEPLFTNNGFENNGLRPDSVLNDAGRYKITGRSSDSLKFKVPSLRNVEVSYPYMHDGRFGSLQMVLFHYSSDIHASPTLSPRLRNGVSLSEEDKNNIIAFLKTLTDEEFLRNRTLYYTAN